MAVAIASNPTVSSGHVFRLVEYFHKHGFDELRVIKSLGRYAVLVPAVVGRIPLQQVSALHQEYANFSGDAYFGLKFGLQSNLAQFQLALDALRQVNIDTNPLTALSGILRLFSDAIVITVQQNENGVCLTFQPSAQTRITQYQFDGMLALCKKCIEYFAPGTVVTWEIPRTLTELDLKVYQQYLCGHVIGGGAGYRIYGEGELPREVDYTDTAHYNATLETMSKFLALQNKQAELCNSIWDSIERYDDVGIPKLERISELSGLSVRQIQYQLKECNLTFQQLLDGFLMEKALCHMQQQPEIASANELSELLGFSEVRSFKRSFKRWFGGTYSKVLEKLGE